MAKPQALGALLKDFLKQYPHRDALRRGMVLNVWPVVVGEQIARQAQDLRFEGDRLVVRVEHSAWRNELHMNRATIIRKLNQKVGASVVKDLVVRA